MVRLRANEVVDDRILLARARAEIKRLKRRLREALEGTLLGTAAEDDDNDGHCPNESSRICHNRNRKGTPEETKSFSGNIDHVSPGGTGGGPARGVKDEGDEEHSRMISTVANNAAAQHSCSSTVAGSEESLRVSASPPPPSSSSSAATADTTVAAAAAAATAVQKRKAAKLIAENESLREDNARLREDVKRLTLQSNKQRLKRQRRHPQSGGGGGARSVGGRPPSSPIDWSARYAAAAADARRRRPASSSSSRHPDDPARRASSSPSRGVVVGRRRSASPSQATAAVPSSALRLPKFRKRQFAVDEGRGQDSGGEGEPVEDALTAEEVRAIIGNSTETEAASGSPEQKVEEEQEAEDAKQLAMLRREIQEGVVSGSLVKRGGGGGSGRGTATIPVKSGAAIGIGGDGDNDGDNVNGKPDEQADIEVFIDHSQRLEDLLFEAQDRERRRLRGERRRLASARAQRLALEAQLADLMAGAGGEVVDVHADTSDSRTTATLTTNTTATSSSVARFPAGSTSSPRTDSNRGKAADAKIKVQQLQDQHQDRRGGQPPPPCYDGALAAPDTYNLMATATPPVFRALGTKEKGISINIGDGKGQARTGWTDQSSRTTRGTHSITNVDSTPTPATTATTTAMMMAVLASPETTTDGGEVYDPHRRAHNNNRNSSNDNSAVEAFPGGMVQRAVPAIKPPLERRRRQRQTGTQNQNPIPSSPSSLHRHPLPSPSVQRRRPATSTGGPPTGSNRARSSSRRIYRRKVGGSRSPVRGKPSAFLEPASPQVGPHDGGSEERRPRRRQQGKLGSGGGGGGGGGGDGGGGSSAIKVAATHPRLARSSPEQKQRFGKEFLGADADDQRKRGLSYSVADLGLRLKVRNDTLFSTTSRGRGTIFSFLNTPSDTLPRSGW